MKNPRNPCNPWLPFGVFPALGRLGLELTAAKGLGDFLVIEHLERPLKNQRRSDVNIKNLEPFDAWKVSNGCVSLSWFERFRLVRWN
jgi:hypothetical protein